MNNISHNNTWNVGVKQVQVEPPPIKSKHDDKSDQDFVKLKLRRDPMSEKSDLYEFQMALFDNGYPEEFLISSQIQHDSRGIKNSGYGREGTIST